MFSTRPPAAIRAPSSSRAVPAWKTWTDDRLGLELRLGQARDVAARARQQIGHDVGGQAHHQHLAFRVAETGVELHDLGPVLGRHQTGIEHAAIGHPLQRHGLERRLDDATVGCQHQVLVEHRGRRIGPHATRVGPHVAVIGALVVLGPAEQQGALAVAQGEQRALLAGHELLDDHAGPGLAKPTAQHALDLGLSVMAIRADGHALSGRQAVGLDDIGRLEHLQRGARVLDPLIDAIVGRGDLVAGHEGLGEGLGGLQLGRAGSRAETGDAGRVQPIRQPGLQSHFRSDHDQADAQFPRQPRQTLCVVGLVARQALGDLGDAGIARRAVDALDQRRLADFPGQGVLAPTRPDEEDIHVRAMAAQAGPVKGRGRPRSPRTRRRRRNPA